jgi:autotransporter passenger strand-loop-strand repeat protein
MYAYDGGIIASATVESTGAMHVSSGGVANDIAVDSGAKLYVSSGATVNRLTVNIGAISASYHHVVFHGGAVGNDINIYGELENNQYNVSAYGDAVLSKVYQSGGGLWVYENANVKDLTVEKGEMVFQDTAYGSDVKVSGASAFLYVRNNALVENLHVSGAKMGFGGGTIRNAVFEGSVAGLKASTGFLIESASFDNGAVISAIAGGSLNSVTVGNGAQLQVLNGGEVTNLVINATTNANRLRVSDGGHISGMVISGTAHDRNYVSMFDGSGLIEDVTTEKAGIYLASGGIIRNVTMRSASVILRGEFPYASGATVSGGGYLYFQNGAKGENIVVNGGNMYVHDDGYAEQVIGSGAKVSGVDLVKGEIKVSAGGKLFDLRASGGSVTVRSTGTTYGDPLLSGATFTGGVLTLSGGAVAKNIKLDGGGAIYGENATLEDFDIEAPTVKGKKLAISGAAMIASGGRINGSSNVGIMDLTGGATFNEAYVSGGSVFLSGLATITNVEQTGGAVILRGEESYVSGATVLGGTLHIQNGGKGDDITIAGGSLSITDTKMTNPAGSSEIVNDVTMTAGSITIGSGGTVNNLNATGGRINVSSAAVLNVEATNVLNNINTYAGARVNFVEHATGVMLQGSNTNIAASTFYYAGAAQALGFTVTNGVVENLGADGRAYRLSVGDEIVVNDAVVTDNCRVSGFGGAVLNRLSISGKNAAASVVLKDNAKSYDAVLTGSNGKTTLLAISGSVIAYDTTVNSGGTLRFNGPTAYASGTVVNSGGKLEYNTGMGGFGHIEDTTLKAGATLTLSDGADTGDKLTLDFTGTTGNQSLTINNLGLVADTTDVVLVGETAGNTYTFAATGATDKFVNCSEWGLYDDSIKAGESITNAFTGLSYGFNAAGTAIAVSEFTAATQATAGSIEDGTTINTNGKAAKWDGNTTATGTIKAATSSIAGDAWLEINGTDLGGTTLFGAEVGFAGEVNLYATGDAVINNLAAGATSSGTVAGVKLTVDSATVGLAYAGGFGTVTGKTETLIGEGAVMQKDFYAGALANYAKTGVVTSGGDIKLSIAGGEFNGNIYGAAAVKAKDATTVVHSVGNVTIDIKGGETKKGDQACIFAGGYATGTTANKVYTVGNVDVTIDGGNWGVTAGGRGVFGGIFASKVTAEAQDVSITINGGSFGNVYGGGWAQQGGTSIVGDVDIDITGGTIANVFGGGTHSNSTGSGGTTEAGNVTINVSGGDITGAIYVGGLGQNDNVTGDEISVNFTGDSDFACGVYGYSRGGGTVAGDAALSFSAYTGEFSGKIGGFVGITLDDDTAMTLTTAAADVSNGKWAFDFTDRDAELAGTSFLTWDGANFAGDTVRVNFTDADQAAAGWSIATADFTGATFDAYAGNEVIATNLAYDTAISGGDWDGWKFTDENGTLKFAKITA